MTVMFLLPDILSYRKFPITGTSWFKKTVLLYQLAHCYNHSSNIHTLDRLSVDQRKFTENVVKILSWSRTVDDAEDYIDSNEVLKEYIHHFHYSNVTIE